MKKDNWVSRKEGFEGAMEIELVVTVKVGIN